jgi:hypothetical protein
VKLTVRKELKLKPRRGTEWESRPIAGFKEEGTDLVILDNHNLEVARFSAADLESWVVEAHCLIEP